MESDAFNLHGRKQRVAIKLMHRAYRLRKEAVELAKEKGFLVSGDRPNDNAMFDDRQKVYLIDTEYWGHEN